MIPNPIHKVLSTLSIHQVRYLLMGGQACVFYGGAEFSRDCDVAILCDGDNLQRLEAALDDLDARRIAIPPFEMEYLLRGHAVHFRCRAPGVEQIRVDVMAKMRGVEPFETLWPRRTTITDDAGVTIELMSLPDLVAAKKTQQDKDWPMIRRLVEANVAQHRESPSDEHVLFWLASSRTPEMLVELAAKHRELAVASAAGRPLLEAALRGDVEGVRSGLDEEQAAERAADESYWSPLKKELETLRRPRS